MALWEAETFDPALLTWAVLPHMHVSRHGFAAAFVGRKLHVYRPRRRMRFMKCRKTGAGFERSITETGEATNVRTLPPAEWKPPEISQERMTRAFGELGMRPVAVPDPYRE